MTALSSQRSNIAFVAFSCVLTQSSDGRSSSLKVPSHITQKAVRRRDMLSQQLTDSRIVRMTIVQGRDTTGHTNFFSFSDLFG